MTDRQTSDVPTVAVLGTGLMGAGIARSIAAAGLPLRVWNRSPDKAAPLREVGAYVADSPVDAVRAAALVITMLHEADAVAAVMGQPGGAATAMADGAVWLQMSTVGVAGTERLATLAAQADVAFVDAPVLGTRQPAENGQLAILASGPDELRARCQPVFDAVGSTTRWLGPAGAGSRLKLVINSWVLALTDATAEAVALARGLDLNPQLFLDTIDGTPTDSRYAHVKGAEMIRDEFPPSFTSDGAEKDTGLILAAARDAGVALSLVEAAHRDFARAVQLGYGEQDMAAVVHAHLPH